MLSDSIDNLDALTDDEDTYLPAGDTILNNRVLLGILYSFELFALTLSYPVFILVKILLF